MDTKQKTPFELLEFILFVDASKGLLHDTEKIMNHNGITYSMVRKELAIKAMEEYASQYQHPVPEASQPAAGYSLQQVADAFEAGAENEYEKHFGAIPPLSLNKETYLASLQPAGNGWVSNNVDFDSPEMKLKIEKVKEEIKANGRGKN